MLTLVVCLRLVWSFHNQIVYTLAENHAEMFTIYAHAPMIERLSQQYLMDRQQLLILGMSWIFMSYKAYLLQNLHF